MPSPEKRAFDLESKRVHPVAFFLRPSPKDDDGLSVDLESPESCKANLTCFGVASLHVGKVRDIDLAARLSNSVSYLRRVRLVVV